jgi:hypothetical protein
MIEHKNYILKDKEVIEVNPDQWIEWMRLGFEKRLVARTDIGIRYSISTVFLTIDHNWSMWGPPILFETMVFTKEGNDEDMERYRTWDEAIAGHERMVDKWSIN